MGKRVPVDENVPLGNVKKRMVWFNNELSPSKWDNSSLIGTLRPSCEYLGQSAHTSCMPIKETISSICEVQGRETKLAFNRVCIV